MQIKDSNYVFVSHIFSLDYFKRRLLNILQIILSCHNNENNLFLVH